MTFRGWSRSLCAFALLCGLAGGATEANAADTGLTPAAKAELEAHAGRHHRRNEVHPARPGD